MANRLVEIIDIQAKKYGKREAYRFSLNHDEGWKQTSWHEFKTQIDCAARALASLGICEKDTIAICSQNMPQILITEFGGFQNRVATIPIYSGSSQAQFDFIVENGGARILFVGDNDQYLLAYDYYKRHKNDVIKIVIFRKDSCNKKPDDSISIYWDEFMELGYSFGDEITKVIEQRKRGGLPDDPATLIYTSGTTGEPKGVVISHSNYDAAMEMHLKALTTVNDGELSMAFLPMSHILEKAWTYFCITKGVRIAINYDPRVIQETIHTVHPNIMCCVPRFWEKVYAGIKEEISSMNALKRILVKRAVKVGEKRNLGYVRKGKKVPSLLEKEYLFWDRMVFYKIKKAIGIPYPNMFPTAGAPLSDRICTFMRAIGIDVKIGYGLSETTATVCCFPEKGYEIGTVGIPLPGLDVKIDQNGEILVKGPTVTPGYFNNPEANEKSFTAEGFFRTGDAGYFNENGALVLTDRIKDLYKTSNGKYIAPQVLESRLAENKYIDEVAVIGDRRKYVTALVVPNFSQLRMWAKENNIETNNIEDLVNDKQVQDFVLRQIENVQKFEAEHEKIKKIRLLPNHFSIMNGEVTNTMKVRRNVVAKRYAKEIESMYE